MAEQEDTIMSNTSPTTTHIPPPPTPKTTTKKSKSQEQRSCTVKAPPFAYAHFGAVFDTPATTAKNADLDALQVRAYFTSALRQFLGDTGSAISVDILVVRGSECWVRVPQPDLGAFAAAITAFGGVSSSSLSSGGGGMMILQLRACGDWLGSLLGRAEEHELWTS
ncbi:hypothetical protein B0H63DRAFT_238622 [Podospora didyma]|uniref:Ribonucleases P/MRP subunit Pop8-like domain-containing protein n=1 Tax=Podospora didyma TaxID=330526 RepID=A0AAE0ND08_9PEZI|nr:hypothetical protein B0H63DRAFT_238622 [Podospora didyma]